MEPFTMFTIVILFEVFFIKHLVIDFFLQTEYQYKNKGTYGHAGGLIHAMLHFVGTGLTLWFFAENETKILILFLAMLDGVFHYHIDYAKMTLASRYGLTHQDPWFWFLLGTDQFAHYLTYTIIIYILLLI